MRVGASLVAVVGLPLARRRKGKTDFYASVYERDDYMSREERRDDERKQQRKLRESIAPATSERRMTLRLSMGRSTAISADEPGHDGTGDHPN